MNRHPSVRARTLATLTIVLAMLSASTALAEGINLSWDDCGLNGAYIKSFACNENTGDPFTMVASFDPPPGVTNLVEIRARLTIDLTITQFPDWWKFGGSLCRPLSDLTADVDFTAGPNSCTDPFAGDGVASRTYQFISHQFMSRGQIDVIVTNPESPEGVSVTPGTEYAAFKVRLARTQSTGPGNCVGCPSPMFVGLSYIQLFQPPELAFNPSFIQPLDRRDIYWQNAVDIQFSPAGAPAGKPAILTATRGGLSGATRVQLGDLDIPFTVDSDTQITTEVPADPRTARFLVETPMGEHISLRRFVCPPVVERVSPAAALVGQTVTFEGYNLGTLVAPFTVQPLYVQFSGMGLLEHSDLPNDTMFSRPVPNGAVTGPIILSNIAGADTTGVFVVGSTTHVPSTEGSALGLEWVAWSSSQVTIRLSLPTGEPATLEVYDASGRRRLSQGLTNPTSGVHLMVLPAPLPAGMYFCRLQQGPATASRPFAVVR